MKNNDRVNDKRKIMSNQTFEKQVNSASSNIEVPSFKERAHDALQDKKLQQALSVIPSGFVSKRAKAKAALPAFSDLSDQAVRIKNHTLANIEKYLEQFEAEVQNSGGQLHFAPEPQDALDIINEICSKKDAKFIAKGKTMVGEEIGLTHFLEEQGYETVETDLGEYLIQLRGEMPSHIIAPAVHLTRDNIRKDFLNTHKHLSKDRNLETPADFVKEARLILREKFINADVGITGANFLIAETGSSVIVTNEGNGDLCQSLPKTHIVIASLEKLVPTLKDTSVLLRLLARSATGQSISTYTTFATGPKREEDTSGPEEFHIVLLDNGRSKMLGSEFAEMLRCIRCGACLNHCPVYQNLGGHAYGTVYPGPMGAVLSPHYFGEKAKDLPFASSFCGRCNEVCPMQIPLTKLMRKLREQPLNKRPPFAKATMFLWSQIAKRPKLYNFAMKAGLPFLSLASKQNWLMSIVPGVKDWQKHRALPEMTSTSFQTAWLKKEMKRKKRAQKKAKEQNNEQ